ncbi:MAG: RHS repeat-associated core domain-containing protein [Cyanobacteria bacterium SZAS LIN-3]|nr:RHS repeat-associated core domain-containing protein [Cyanobacteria bacterium SZAS LIN-3]
MTNTKQNHLPLSGNSNLTPISAQSVAQMIPSLPTGEVKNRAPVDSDTAWQILNAKPKPKITPFPAQSLLTTGGVEGAPSIVELTRALKNDPQLIYEFVYNNIEFTPGMGVAKGAFGTLLDGCGNSFDISALLAALLRQAGFTAYYEVGNLQLTAAESFALFDIKDSNINTALSYVSNLSIPASLVGVSPNQQLKFRHCWIKVNLGTVAAPNWVVMDASYKTYNTITPIAGFNLASAMGYSSSTFLADARVGYTHGTDGSGVDLWVNGLNRTNIRNDLKTYAGNLITWIKNYNSTHSPASLADLIGGRQIVPVTLPFTFPTTLPHEAPSDTVVEYQVDFDPTLKITLQLQWSGLDITLSSDQFYGRRFTWFFQAQSGGWVPVVRIDGITMATGTVVKSSGYFEAINCHVVHHAYPTTNSDQQFYVFVFCPNQNGSTGQEGYLIATMFGTAGKGQFDYHMARQAQFEFNNSNTLDEAACGERLATQWANYCMQYSKVNELIARQTNVVINTDHLIGVAKFQQYGSFSASAFDLQGSKSTDCLLSASATTFATNLVSAMRGYALEMLAVQQLTGQQASSCTRSFDIAVQNGTAIYKSTRTTSPAFDNWPTAVQPVLTGYGSYASVGGTIDSSYEPFFDHIILPQSAPQLSNGLNISCWAAVNSSNNFQGALGIINASVKGGIGPGKGKPTPPKKDNDCEDADPVNIRTGNYLYRHTDISVGSGGFPYELKFETNYDSNQRFVAGTLGLGWRHNWSNAITVGSDGLVGMGSESPISGAAALASLFVSLDLMSDTALPVDKYVMSSLVDQWWVDQLTNNIVTVSLPDFRDLVYTLLPDGSYNPPQRETSQLTLAAGNYTHTTPQKIVSAFNSSGQLTSVVFPFGVTIALTYTAGQLTKVANNLGRSLTIGNSSGRVATVTDGVRTISYGYDLSQNLTNFSDALSQGYVFAYSSPGLMQSYFKPQNPATACVTNTFDSLGRVQSQVDILGHSHTFYLAGSRSEVIDPVGNSEVTYYDQFTNPIKFVDALGYVTTQQYDNLGRLTLQVNPELDTIAYSYDVQNNVLTKLRSPKPGSSLTPLLEKYEYDPLWNKVNKVTDPNNNVTTSNYDPVTGSLLSVTYPSVLSGGSMVAPVLGMTYNGFGQLSTRSESVTASTAIVTQYTYDPSNETLKKIVVDQGAGSHLNLTTNLGYDAAGNLTSLQDPRGYTTTSTWDALRRITKINAAAPFSAQYVQYGYDANSNKISVLRGDSSLGTSQIFTWGFSLSDKVISETDPAGNTESRLYDGADRLFKTIDAEGRTYQFAYDPRNRVNSITDPSGVISETRSYSPNGRISAVHDAKNNMTSYTYDGFDRLDKTTFPDGTFEQNLLYDKNGNVLTFVSRLGVASGQVTATFDALNRLLTKAPTGQPSESYSYDLRSNLLSIVDSALGTFQRIYDSAGRFVQEVYPDSKTVTSVLDANGNVTRLTYPDGYFVERQYDVLNRLIAVKLNGASFPQAAMNYDYLSRRTALFFANGTSSTFDFGASNDLTKLIHTFQGKSVDRLYTFNKVHQITGQNFSDLTYSWQPSASFVDTYGLGTISGSANNLNEIPSLNGTAFAYNNNGCLTNDGNWTHTYDTENHLKSSTKTGMSLAYTYDPYHRQLQKAVTTSGTNRTNYVYSGWQRIADYDNDGNLVNRYIYGATLEEALIKVSASGTVTYLHGDHLGSIVATSDSGGIPTKNVFGLFGETSSLASDAIGFTGQRFDAETGLYYYKRRYYSPKLGRFLQPDPIGYDLKTSENCGCDCTGGCGGAEISTLNLYTYVLNDPLNMFDPMGTNAVIAYDAMALAMIEALILLLILEEILKILNELKKRCPPIKLPPIEFPPIVIPIAGIGILQMGREQKQIKAAAKKFDVDAKKLGDYIEQDIKGQTDAGGADNVKINMENGDISLNGEVQGNVTDVK